MVVLVRSEMRQRVSFQVVDEVRDEGSIESFMVRPGRALTRGKDTIITEEAKRLTLPSAPGHRTGGYIASVDVRAVT
jgi:hypothetical protein